VIVTFPPPSTVVERPVPLIVTRTDVSAIGRIAVAGAMAARPLIPLTRPVIRAPDPPPLPEGPVSDAELLPQPAPATAIATASAR
jgi:hypothetical protein